MITPSNFTPYEIMDPSKFWSLRHVLEEAKKHVISSKNKTKPNAELQVGYYNGVIILGHNTGTIDGYGPVEYVNDIEEIIKECVTNNGLFQRTDVKKVIIVQPDITGNPCHAEMNIIRTVLQKIRDKSLGFEQNDGELFIAGDKYPCVKCMEKIYTLNRSNATNRIKILIPDYYLEYKGERVYKQYDSDPKNWTDPL